VGNVSLWLSLGPVIAVAITLAVGTNGSRIAYF